MQGILPKPYHRRKTTLFDSITGIIDERDMFVHAMKPHAFDALKI